MDNNAGCSANFDGPGGVNEATNFATYKDFHRAVGRVRMNRNTDQRLYVDGHLVPLEPSGWHYYDCEIVDKKECT